jgi:hypothetical protein
MDDGKVHERAMTHNDEDYTGACCLLLWKEDHGYCQRRWQVLIDANDLPWMSMYTWRVNRVGKLRLPRAMRHKIGKGVVYLHRYLTECPTGLVVDHINHDPLDNRRGNLRVCTVSQNNMNTRPSLKKASRFRGVAWNPSTKNWQVYVGFRTRKVMVGRFTDEIAAARAYNEFAEKAYGPYAYLNPV